MSAEDQKTEATLPTSVEMFAKVAETYESSTGGSTRAVTREILQLEALQGLFAAPHDAVVLDNACGTAIVAEEIIAVCRRQPGGDGAIPIIHAADPVENMIGISSAKFSSLGASERCSAAVMPGEKLAFADDTFTHSITNMGILFYTDAATGAREIYRTLKPGGVAVVTTWSHLGYLDDIVNPAQKRARPDAEMIKLPIAPRWFDPVQVEQCLRKDGGFSQIKVELRKVHYVAPSSDVLSQQLLQLFFGVFQAWPEGEKDVFRQAVREITEQVAVPCTRADGSSGVGVPMTAIIAICEK